MAFMMLFLVKMIRQNQLIQQQMQLLSVVARRKVLAAQLAADPTLVLRNEIEAFTQK
jgi:hypothetical protein